MVILVFVLLRPLGLLLMDRYHHTSLTEATHSQSVLRKNKKQNNKRTSEKRKSMVLVSVQ